MKEMLFPEVDTPALLLNEERLRGNIAVLQAQADQAGLALRPHAKAHKCAQVARLQLAAGAVGLCCAKLGEAEVLAQAGVPDLLVTTPVVGALKIARLMRVARQAAVKVVVDDERNIHDLAQAAQAAGIVLAVLIEVDVGQRRCGVPPGPRAAELACLVRAAPSLTLAGMQGYQGGLQCVADYTERRASVLAAMAALKQSVDAVRQTGMDVPVITGGGTGSFPIDIELASLTELQPGSYVTMDRAYAAIDWTGKHAGMPLQKPLSILASVISRPARDRAILDVGWKSASSDGAAPACLGHPGLIFEFAGDEHGQVRAANGGDLDLACGDRLELVPGHCDTTVNLFDSYVVHAQGRAYSTWSIEARGMSS
jgi:D-serine deaminase-like pyridoxal phosphate-dependent protein